MNKKIILIVVILIIILLVIKYNKNYKKAPEESVSEEIANINTEIEESDETNINSINMELKDYVTGTIDTSVENNSEILRAGKNIDGLAFSDISLTGNRSEMKFKGRVKNVSSETKGDRDVTLVMIDDQEKEIGKLAFHLIKLEPEEEMELDYLVDITYVNSYDFELKDGNLVE